MVRCQGYRTLLYVCGMRFPLVKIGKVIAEHRARNAYRTAMTHHCRCRAADPVILGASFFLGSSSRPAIFCEVKVVVFVRASAARRRMDQNEPRTASNAERRRPKTSEDGRRCCHSSLLPLPYVPTGTNHNSSNIEPTRKRTEATRLNRNLFLLTQLLSPSSPISLPEWTTNNKSKMPVKFR
jgi:hypothetical protein